MSVKQDQQRLFAACLRNLTSNHNQLQLLIDNAMWLDDDNYIAAIWLQQLLKDFENEIRAAYGKNYGNVK